MNVTSNVDACHGFRGATPGSPMKILVLAILAISSATAFAHSGGTDSNGCHNDRRTGGYHCH